MSLKNNLLYMSEDTKNMVTEVGALSGISQIIVKEIFEYMLVDFAVKIAEHPDELVTLDIPYIGQLKVKYKGDRALSSGELDTEVETYIELAQSFKNLIGDIHDEGYTDLVPVMTKKIEQAIMVATTEE